MKIKDYITHVGENLDALTLAVYSGLTTAGVFLAYKITSFFVNQLGKVAKLMANLTFVYIIELGSKWVKENLLDPIVKSVDRVIDTVDDLRKSIYKTIDDLKESINKMFNDITEQIDDIKKNVQINKEDNKRQQERIEKLEQIIITKSKNDREL